MATVVKLIRYILALAFVIAGAGVIGFHIAATLAGVDPSTLTYAQIAEKSITSVPVSPVWHLGVGGAIALVGLLVAKPAFTIKLGGGGGREERRSLRTIINELTHLDSAKRLRAAKDLTNMEEASAIPALIKALRDPIVKVRGQAAEALLAITDLDFDFVDISSEKSREESVTKWRTWWSVNKSHIIAGKSPKEFDEDTIDGVDLVTTTPLPRSKTAVGHPPRRSKTAATGLLQKQGGSRRGRATPLPAAVAARTTPGSRPKSKPSESGRNVSLGDIVRKKRELRDGLPKGGAPVPGAPEPSEEPIEDAPIEEAPIEVGAAHGAGAMADSPPKDAASGGEELSAADLDDLPSPDDELPPPE